MIKNKKLLIMVIPFLSLLFIFAGCTSAGSQADISVPIEMEIPEETVTELVEDKQEEIIEETADEKVEDIVEEIKDESTDEIQEEVKEETTENQLEESNDLTEEEALLLAEDEAQVEKANEIVEEDTKEDVKEEPVEEEKEEYCWVLNTNTKKVHDPSCSSVNEMKEKNKKLSNLSPEELKAKGYEPCKRCKPFK